LDEIKDKGLLRRADSTIRGADEEHERRNDDELTDRGYLESIGDWREEVPRNFPRQRPGSSDCGVYVCTFAAALSSLPPLRKDHQIREDESIKGRFSFRADDMDDMRHSIAWLLLDYLQRDNN